MSLRVVVAAPYRQHGERRLTESEFTVALSLDRDWFTPDQATRIAETAITQGLLSRDSDDALVAEFDPSTVEIPPEFSPGENLLQERSAFELVLDALVDAGHPKHEVVAGINRTQANLDITVGAAAVVYARAQGVTVPGAVEQAHLELAEPSTD